MEHLSSELVVALCANQLDHQRSERLRAHCVVCPVCFELLAAQRREPALSMRRSSDAPRRRLERGARLGRYEVMRALGEGGEATVYEAFDPLLERKVALKLLHQGVDSAQQGRRARLVREARVMARLTHPSVLTIYDVVEDAGESFIAMELVEGCTLRTWLSRGQLLADVVTVFGWAGEGLAAAHHEGIVHRDFKPENVLVDVRGRVKVTDFGLARRRGDSRPVDGDEGTPGYLSPEQRAGRPGDPKSDQYAFCVALIEAAGASKSLRTLLSRGLLDDPALRFSSMDELLDALARRRISRPVRARSRELQVVNPLT